MSDKPKDYDLVLETGSLSTTASNLVFNNTTSPVITPDDYVQKVYKITLTNTGSSTATFTLTASNQAYLTSIGSSETATSYNVLTVSVPASTTVFISELEVSIVIPATFNLIGVSTGTGNIQLLAYFTPA